MNVRRLLGRVSVQGQERSTARCPRCGRAMLATAPCNCSSGVSAAVLDHYEDRWQWAWHS